MKFLATAYTSLKQMYQHLTKLSLTGVGAVAILALGVTSIHSTAFADKPIKPSPLPIECDQGTPFAKWDGNAWQCDPGTAGADGADGADVDPAIVDALQNQLDNLGFLASGGQIVFVTSSEHSGNLGGIAGAYDICNDLAVSARLPGVYKAWLADMSSSSEPASRFIKSLIGYIRPDGVIVADDWDDLADGDIDAPIEIDETGVERSLTNVWTNVDTDGTMINALDKLSCAGFAGGDDFFTAVIGSAG